MRLYLDDPIKRANLDAGLSACGQFRKFGHPYKPRENTGGNYCGHDPAKPSLELDNPATRGKGGYPSIIAIMQELIQQFYSRPKILPSLSAANRSQTGRQMRSEARESCVIIMSVMIQHTCLASLRVGMPTSEGFMHFSVRYFVKVTGLSESRVKRAFRYLEWAGIISVTQRAELQLDGTYKGVPAIRCVSESFFQALGKIELLKYTRRKRSEALKEEAKRLGREEDERPLSLTAEGRRGLMMKSIGNLLKGGNKRRIPKSEDQKMRDMEIIKQVHHQAAMLKIEHPDWDRDKIYQVAEKQIVG